MPKGASVLPVCRYQAQVDRAGVHPLRSCCVAIDPVRAARRALVRDPGRKPTSLTFSPISRWSGLDQARPKPVDNLTGGRRAGT